MEKNTTIKIPKDFTVEDAAKFRSDINIFIENGDKHFIVDFSNCNFIDSTGLGVLVAAYKKCIENGGSIKLIELKEPVKKLFNLTRLDKVFEIC